MACHNIKTTVEKDKEKEIKVRHKKSGTTNTDGDTRWKFK